MFGLRCVTVHPSGSQIVPACKRRCTSALPTSRENAPWPEVNRRNFHHGTCSVLPWCPVEGRIMINRSRILIADDHTLVAELCKRLLETEFEVVGVVSDGHALV